MNKRIRKKLDRYFLRSCFGLHCIVPSRARGYSKNRADSLMRREAVRTDYCLKNINLSRDNFISLKLPLEISRGEE